jgi:hypothetical protein
MSKQFNECIKKNCKSYKYETISNFANFASYRKKVDDIVVYTYVRFKNFMPKL